MADKRISQLIERTDIANNDVLPIVASGATTTNKVTVSTLQDWMQDNLDVGVTSVGITIGSTGTDVSVSGSPITSSGNITINLPTASAVNRGALSSADWTTFNSKQQAITLTTTGTSGAATLVSGTLNIPNYSTDLSGYVTLGTTQTITAQKTFTTSGSSDTMIISHGSGSGFALDVLKAGSGEAIRVTKTSGSGNAMTISGGNFEAPTIVKTGGTSSQFLKADGSVDSSSYALNSSLSLYLPLTGGTISGQLNVGSGNLRIAAEGASNITILRNFTGTAQGQSGFNNIGFNNSNNFYFTKNLNNGAIFAFTNTAYQTYTLQDASGTLAFTSQIPANPVGGTGTANIIPKFTGGSTLGDSSLQNVSNSISNLNPPSGQFAWQLNGNATTGQSFGALVVAGTNASDIAFAVRNTGGVTTLFEVQGDGNVGIGTNSPDVTGFGWKTLTIKGGTASGEAGVLELQSPATTGAANLGIIAFLDGSNRNAQISGVRDGANNSGALSFVTWNAGTGAERLRIASTGAATFSSSVTAQSFGISNGYYLVGRNAANTAFRTLVTFDSSNKILIGQDSDITAITLGVGSEAMRISSSGNVGIGNTPSDGFTGYRLQVGSISDNQSLISIGCESTGVGPANGLVLGCDLLGANIFQRENLPLNFWTNNTKRLILEANGTLSSGPQAGSNAFSAIVSASSICYLSNPTTTSDFTGYWQVGGNFAGSITHPTSTTTNYNVTSDYRLKENISPLLNGLDSILKLNPVEGNFINDDEKTNMAMFIAHEVQEVIPIAVTGEKDAMKIDKITGEEIMDIQQLDASKLIPYMVKAIQELKEQIDSLKNQIK
jgi:hypothetical protein